MPAWALYGRGHDLNASAGFRAAPRMHLPSPSCLYPGCLLERAASVLCCFVEAVAAHICVITTLQWRGNSLDVNENGNTPVGSLTFKSNLTWEPASGAHTSLKLETIADPGTQNICTTSSAITSNCDYNTGYLLGTDESRVQWLCEQERGYAAKWSYSRLSRCGR